MVSGATILREARGFACAHFNGRIVDYSIFGIKKWFRGEGCGAPSLRNEQINNESTPFSPLPPPPYYIRLIETYSSLTILANNYIDCVLFVTYSSRARARARTLFPLDAKPTLDVRDRNRGKSAITESRYRSYSYYRSCGTREVPIRSLSSSFSLAG